VALADIQSDLPDDVHERVDAPLERAHRGGVDRDALGRARGATLAHLSVVVFALINVIGLLAYAFKGIGKFAVVMLPWRFTGHTTGLFTDENIYALILMGLTSIYAIKGGMISVVITEVTPVVASR